MRQITTFILILLLLLTISLHAQEVPCINGMAGSFPCNQITLLSHLTKKDLQANDLNDIWGWEDPENGNEYALVGLTDGVTFVDVTDPINPIVVGKLAETHLQGGRIMHGESSWRDIKVYKDHAYIISDGNANHGMQILDLTRLRSYNGSFLNFDEDAFYNGIGSSHNIVINEATGYAFIVGARGASVCGGGGLHILDIKEPKNPRYVGCFDDDGYTHDAQCLIYAGPDATYEGKEICFNSNEDTFTIVDVDDKNNMTMISRTGYGEVEYTHQGWLTEDHQFFLMNDELDENASGFNPRTLIWDVKDLDNPVLIGEYYNNEPSIDHNLYTKGNLVFESNYSSGLRVLSSENVENGKLREVAYFDTDPTFNVISFRGSWSNYPYFKSGTIVVSDISNGLYVLKLDLKEEIILSHPEDKEVCANGQMDEFTVNIQAHESVTYQWQLFNGLNYINIADNSNFHGSLTNTLSFNPTEKLSENGYKCRITTLDGSIFDTYVVHYSITGEYPTPNFSFSNGLNNTVSFTNSSSDADTYLWDFGDGTTSFEENPIHTYSDQIEYNVSLSASNFCGTTTSSKTLKVSECVTSDLPIALFTFEQNGNEYVFTNNSTNAISYQWNLGDGNTSDLQNLSHTYEESGNYIVTLEALNLCGSSISSETIEHIVLGIDKSKTISVYPNPFTKNINVNIDKSVVMRVFDSSGKTLIYQYLNAGENNVELNELKAGIYWVSLQNDDSTHTIRIIKR